MNQVTVTMPIEEYERLKGIEDEHAKDVAMLRKCSDLYHNALIINAKVKVPVTAELKKRIKSMTS